MIAQSKISDTSLAALNRLLCCSSQGLLTSEQKRWLGDFIWHDGEPRLPAYWLDTVLLKLPSQHEEDEVRYLCRSIANKISNDTSGAIRFPGGRDVFNELIAVSFCHANDFSQDETSQIIESSKERIVSLADHINYGLISLAIRICLLQKYIRYYMHFGFLQLFAHRRFCQKKNILYCQRFLLNVTHTILVTMVQRDFGLCS